MKEYLSRIYSKSADEYYRILKNDLEKEKKNFTITVNPEIIVKASNNSAIGGMLLDEGVNLVPDGIAVVKACQSLNMPVTERITGIDIAKFLLEELNRQKKSLYLLGAKSEVVEILAKKIKEEYKDIKLLGYTDGYTENKDGVFSKIAELQPDVCLVALGVPTQEELIYKHIDKFSKGIFVGVGGSFDVLSGTKARAPEFFIKHNIEWLYRIAKEPKRLKRFYDNNIKFLLDVKKCK